MKSGASLSARESEPVAGAIRSPERALAAAVVQQAIDDALASRNTTHVLSASVPRGIDAEAARSFLTSAGGDWAMAREVWCDVAGVNPDALRDRALAGRLRASRSMPGGGTP